MDRYMLIRRGEREMLEPSLIGEWIRYTDAQVWNDALKLLDARIRGSVASDPLHLHEIVKGALYEPLSERLDKEGDHILAKITRETIESKEPLHGNM